MQLRHGCRWLHLTVLITCWQLVISAKKGSKKAKKDAHLEKEIKDGLATMDLDKDGKLSIEEVLESMYNHQDKGDKKGEEVHRKVMQRFRMADEDKDAHLDEDEIGEMLKLMARDVPVEL
eukprot:TRINITY_DN19959_c0_g1_i1.p1 TRINITY_DN19959_c0_g1~~TRINITY_DN19959_c0_g1_i1.p1  ORF type:complete len:120 (+),score=31.07 TRINITY_DN19959_c0_g1_i1:92-451(+)